MKRIFLLCTFIFLQISLFAQDSNIVFHPNRLIKLEGGSNFRDLGGYPTNDGKHVKWKHIYRSADISKLTDNDLQNLQNLNLTTVCDLRGPDELKNSPDRLPQSVHYINLPAGSENIKVNNFASMNRDSMMLAMYSSTDYLKAKYEPMFEALLIMPAEKSLMFHCTAGKDRTGIGAALVLSALGVEEKYIVADYKATNVFWKQPHDKMLQAMVQRGISENMAKSILEAKSIYIETFLQTINRQYGSMDIFLEKEMELTAPKIKQLKEKFLY